MILSCYQNLFKKKLVYVTKLNTETRFPMLNDDQNRKLSRMPTDWEIKIAIFPIGSTKDLADDRFLTFSIKKTRVHWVVVFVNLWMRHLKEDL